MEFFDPFLYNVRLNESFIIDTAEVDDDTECAQLCLDKDDVCLAFDVTFSVPRSTCHFAGEQYETIKVPFSFGNINLQIEKFRGKYNSRISTELFCLSINVPLILRKNVLKLTLYRCF